MLGDDDGLRPRRARDAARRDVARPRRRQDDPDRARRGRPRRAAAGAVPDGRGRPAGGLDLDEVGRGADRRRRGARRGRARAWRSAASSSAVGGAAAHPAARSSGWAGSAAASWATAATPTSVRPRPASRAPTSGAAQDAALDVVQELRRLLGLPRRPAAGLDADLRPEGKKAPGAQPGRRTPPTTRAGRWSWEAQALLRATPIAGDADLGRAFRRADRPAALARRRARRPAGARDPPPQGADGGRAAAARRRPRTPLQARPRRPVRRRVDGPAAAAAARAHVPELRTTATLPALRRGRAGRARPARPRGCLGESWRLASRLRNASVLSAAGRSTAFPADLRVADGVSRILGGEPGTGAELGETYRRVARRARSVVEFDFYGSA